MKQLRLLAAVAGVVIVSKLLVEDVFGLDLAPFVSSWVVNAGAGSAAVIVLLLASDVLLPVPSSLVMVLSGAAFGVGWGACLALAGSVAGEWLGFELVRKYGRRLSSRIAGDDDIRRLDWFFERHGAIAIIVTRPIPIVMETISVVAGLSRMTRRTFVVASVIGTAPIVLLYAYAGAMSRQAGTLLPAAAIVVSVAAAGWLWYRMQFSAAAGSRASVPRESD
jgi:3-dehydroquinate synthase